MRGTGSPESRTITKTIVETPQRTSTACSNRPAMKRPIVSLGRLCARGRYVLLPERHIGDEKLLVHRRMPVKGPIRPVQRNDLPQRHVGDIPLEHVQRE